MSRCTAYLILTIVALALCWALSAGAQGQPPLTQQMTEVLKYSGVENPAAADVDRLVELWQGAQKPGINPEEQTKAFRDFYLLLYKLLGRDMTARPEALTPTAAFAVTSLNHGGRMDLTLPTPRGIPSGDYCHVQTFGNGPRQLLLIGDMGIDARKLFSTFIARNQSKYTMHVVTLPWIAPAKPLPWAPTSDPTKKIWLTHLEQELVRLVDARKWKDLTVIGPNGGGYLAARLALTRPQAFRAAVLVDALVNVTMRSPRDPDAPISLEDRLSRVRVRPPLQVFPIAPMPQGDELRRLIADANSTHPTARNWMNFSIKDDAVSQPWSFEALSSGFFLPGAWYGAELGATDLTADMQKLTVPVLVMSALHDDGSRLQSPPSQSQWWELKLRNPKLPITITSFADTRSYIMADEPAAFDAALEAFLAGRTPEGKSEYSLPRASPLARVTQWVGATQIKVSYGSPGVKDRKIWGGQVPYGRVWRAGANEATTIAFGSPVTVEGKPLAAGVYTFFVIPTEKEWTVIFNRVPAQWGAFNYNPEFDALRFTVTPEDAAPQEYLQYTVDVASPVAGRITLRWEKKKISFAIAAADTSPAK